MARREARSSYTSRQRGWGYPVDMGGVEGTGQVEDGWVGSLKMQGFEGKAEQARLEVEGVG